MALAGCPEGTTLEVVMEPTGPAWLPIAVFFVRRGHRVFRVSSQKAADLRRFLSRHTKTNGIDAETLAKLPIFRSSAVCRPLALPERQRAALDRRVRATDRLTRTGAVHKRRIKDLVRQLIPMSPLSGDLGVADLTVLERYGDPNALVKGGRKAPRPAVIAKASHGQQGTSRARQWIEAARAALKLYAGHPAVAFADLAAEVATEVRLLRSVQSELDAHAWPRAKTAIAGSTPAPWRARLPGLAEVGGPALVASMGDPARFRRANSSAPSPVLSPRPPRPGRPTARARP